MTEATFKVVCPHDGAINRVPLTRLAENPRCGGCHQPLFHAQPVELDAAGFDRHLTKPVDPAELEALLRAPRTAG